jgi:heme-degrading monooxygenase HmoA
MSEITFFNMWEADSHEKQEGLIEEMRREAPALAAKDGFVSLTAWKAEGKDYRILVEGRWASQADFEAAVAGNAQALASRAVGDSRKTGPRTVRRMLPLHREGRLR